MQRYAYHTGCRRHFVLKYFGDPAAARSACAGCDNCLGIKHAVQASALAGAVPKGAAARARARSADGGRRAGGAGAAVAEPVELVLGPEDAGLFGALRALRAEIARAEQVPRTSSSRTGRWRSSPCAARARWRPWRESAGSAGEAREVRRAVPRGHRTGSETEAA
jgi:superfamily II DNA helicase RecQ